jgi:hypothetical protein
MKIQIELRPETKARLESEACALGMAPETYLVQFVEEHLGADQLLVDPHTKKSVGEAIDRILELRKGDILSGLKSKDLIRKGHKYEWRSRRPQAKS